MKDEAVRDNGLTPQDGGEEAAQPQDAPEEPGSGTVPAHELRKVFKELRKWKDKYRELQAKRVELEEREKSLAELKGRLADAHLARLLTDAAASQDAINPEQVASFLRERVALGDDLKPQLVATGGEGGPATVEDLVSEFLSQFPHHRKARLSGGSGSTPAPTAAADTLKEQIRGAASHEELERIVSRKQP
jgi:hypothetical protein